MTRKHPPLTPAGYQNSQRDRAKATARETGFATQEILDLHYHRRLLARVFHREPDRWVLKGGQALLMRWPNARYSTDVDLLSAEKTTDDAVEALKQVAALELYDHITFAHHDTSEQTHVDRPTRKVRFTPMFGTKPVHRMVSVDVVVADHRPRGEVTTEPLDPPFATDCGLWPPVRMFPIEDHIAEKICAMYERHRADGRPSTRYKDLADLIIIARRSPVAGAMLHRTLREEINRRESSGMVITIPAVFEVPDSSWHNGYRAIAKDIRDLPDELRTLAGAHPTAHAFLTPLLNPTPPNGTWQPTELTWR